MLHVSTVAVHVLPGLLLQVFIYVPSQPQPPPMTSPAACCGVATHHAVTSPSSKATIRPNFEKFKVFIKTPFNNYKVNKTFSNKQQNFSFLSFFHTIISTTSFQLNIFSRAKFCLSVCIVSFRGQIKSKRRLNIFDSSLNFFSKLKL